MTVDYSKLYDREALKEILAKYRKRILKEVDSVKDLTTLLMIGTQRSWTKSELLLIKTHFVIIGKKIPILMVFLLPGGLILLPLLVEVLDRRKRDIPVAEEKRSNFQEKSREKRGSKIT
jgi:hypothetical protein